MRNFSRLPLPTFVYLISLAVFLFVFSGIAKADTTGFLSLINNYRSQNGLGTLSEDQNLTNAACWFASDMGAKNYFPGDHVDSLGRSMSQRLSDFGINGSRAENIYYTTAGSSANNAFNDWKESSGHNENMLNGTYTRIGIGRANFSGKWYWVTDFANGSATTPNNQCGVSITPPPTPQPTPPPAPVKKTPPPPPISAEPTPVETPAPETPLEPEIATLSAKLASKAATKSAKLIELNKNENNKKGLTLVQGAAATTIVLGNLILFAFIVLNLYKHHKFLKVK